MGVVGTRVDTAVSDGLRIVYETAGAGDPPVVLLPGGFEDRTYYEDTAAHLGRRHRVLSVDLRGQGQSDRPDRLTLADLERDVIAVAEAAGLERAVLCGHSASGAVALSVASARPDLAAAVVMLDGVVFFPEAVRQQALANLLPALEGDHWLEALRGYFGRLVGPEDPPEVRERVMSDLGRWDREVARTFFGDIFGSEFEGRERRLADALKHSTFPILYIRGTSPADLGRLREIRPDAMIGQVVGSGHYLPLSAADQVNAMLDRFLEIVASG